MVQIIYGKKGSGKTKRLIDLANETVKDEQGNVLFIDDDNRYIFDLRHEIRFINAGDYGVRSAQMFCGFICGLLAQNFDIRVLFVDAFLKLVQDDLRGLAWLFESLDKICQEHNVRLVISCSGATDDAPEFMQKYLI